MNVAAVIMLAIAVILLGVAYLQGDNLHLLGLKTAAKMFVQIIPILVAAFIIAGMVQVLIPKEFIIKWLGQEAGFKGILFGTLAGSLTPGGPIINFPIVASIYKSGRRVDCAVFLLKDSVIKNYVFSKFLRLSFRVQRFFRPRQALNHTVQGKLGRYIDLRI